MPTYLFEEGQPVRILAGRKVGQVHPVEEQGVTDKRHLIKYRVAGQWYFEDDLESVEGSKEEKDIA